MRHFLKIAGTVFYMLAVCIMAGCAKTNTEFDGTQEEITAIAQEKLEAFVEMSDTCFADSIVAEGSYTNEDFKTIHGNGGYLPVSKFASIEEAKNYVMTVCTKQLAENLCNKYWNLDGSCPLLAELDGKLYAQAYDGMPYPKNYEIL